MIDLFDALARPLMGLLEAENAHRLAVNALKLAPLPPAAEDNPRLAVRAFGLNFRNPVGMAAGFDKHGEVPDALLRLGFGFVEVGTVTPLPQPGNPRPRLFRLPADEGVINRLGFNSEGADAVLRRLAARAAEGGIVGINVGANKDSSDRIADYVRQIEMFAPVASYFTCNISSPNTPGLREAKLAGEAGGLSGSPLRALATRMLAESYVRVEGVFPLIGAGGIDSGAAALAKVRAGASLLQLYSALVFRGHGLVAEIKSALLGALGRHRLDSLAELVGADAAAATAEPWPN